MRELDQLMLRYLERRWPQADAAERAEFERLLAVEDDRLWRWFMRLDAVDDAGLKALVEHIESLPP